MVRKRLDDRVRFLLENAVATHQRAMLVLVGDRGKDQVPILHQILSKMSLTNPETLWCYKKTLGFSTHRMKRLKKIKRDKSRGLLADDDSADAFELFLSHGSISWVFYKESHRVLGRTVDLLVLQDFEALTPNLLARTIETVRGGGLIVVLLKTVESLQQLYSMTMDVHARYRTESNSTIVPRFNERFILSLGRNKSCLVCDDELNVLPLSKKALLELQRNGGNSIPKGDGGEVIKRQVPVHKELAELKENVADMPHIGALVDLAKTLDQAKAVLTFMDACTDKEGGVVTMTAARGRGKSAALGLCLAGAVALGFSTIAVTAPEPENVNALFDFIAKGLKALKYQEQVDFDIVYNNAAGRDEIKCVTAIRLHRSHRQVIQYLDPQHKDKFASAELIAIDEAAAIPLPTVRSLIQPDRLVFLSSTVNGYEGTGRALSLKLIQELRNSKGGRDAELSAAQAAVETVGKRSHNTSKRDAAVHEQRYEAAAAATRTVSKSLREIELESPIRYAPGDGIENWLNRLLCLDSSSSWKLNGSAPAPADCELYSVDRDALFSYHKLSEAFLQKLMGLYTSAHYKNTPNDLQMLSDAPAHSLFVLLPPVSQHDSSSLPDVLAVVQVALEGKVSRKAVEAQLARGHRSAGDLIPWTLSQQFGDTKFAQLSGARIVRIAVHPTVQGMGYGSRAMELLYRFYNGEMVSLADGEEDDNDADMEENGKDVADESDEEEDDELLNGQGLRGERLKPKKELPPLLLPLTEVEAPQLDWIGTSFGLTLSLHKFWTRCGMKLLYLRQTKNDLTGEHSAILIRALPKRTGVNDSWLPAFVTDARRRLTMLLGGSFRDMNVKLAMSIFDEMEAPASITKDSISADELEFLITPYDRKRLELYGRNLCDHHLVTDLLPVVARLYFTGRFGKDISLSSVQAALLCGIGLQSKIVDCFVHELGLPINQVLAMFNKAVRKISIGLNAIVERREEEKLLQGEKRKTAESILEGMNSETAKTLDEDLQDAAVEAHEKLNTLPPEVVENPDLLQYVVKGSEKEWEKALEGRQIEGDVEASTILITSRKEIMQKREAEQPEPSVKGGKKSSGKKNKKRRQK